MQFRSCKIFIIYIFLSQYLFIINKKQFLFTLYIFKNNDEISIKSTNEFDSSLDEYFDLEKSLVK